MNVAPTNYSFDPIERHVILRGLQLLMTTNEQTTFLERQAITRVVDMLDPEWRHPDRMREAVIHAEQVAS